jgi:hypothetical protein
MFATIGKSESRTSWILIGLVAATAIIIGLAVVVRHKNAVSDQRSQPNTISTQPSDGSATTPSSSKILTKDPEFLRLLHPLQGDDLLETSTEYTTKKQEIESKLASIQDPELRQRLSDEEWEQVDKSAYIKNEEGHLRASFPSAMQACLQKHRTDWFEVGHVEYLSTGMLRISSVEASPLELPDGATVSIDVATMNAVYSKFRVVAKDQIKQNLDVWVYEQSCSSRLTNACINLGGTPEECADPTKLREIEDSLGQGGLFADCKANPSLEEGREIVENKMRSERLVLVGQGDPIDHRMDKLLLVDYDTENVLLEISASALNGTINWKFPLGENPRGTVLPVQAQIEPSLTATQIQAVALAIIADEINYCSYTKDPKVLSYMRPRQPLTPCHEEFRRAIIYKPVILSASGQRGVIVSVSPELLMGGGCGASGNCPLHVLQETADGYRIVLDGIGAIQSVAMAKESTRGFYNVIIHGGTVGMPMTISYAWNSSKYEVAGSLGAQPQESSTNVVHYMPPTNLPNTDRKGSCWESSAAASYRTDAWRCMDGNTIYDPCFSLPGKMAVACDVIPTEREKGFRLTLTKPLPKPFVVPQDRRAKYWGWLIELDDGMSCSPFTGERPFGADYGCTSKTKGGNLPENWTLLTGLDGHSTLWSTKKTILVKSGSEWKVKSINSVSVKTAWQ